MEWRNCDFSLTGFNIDLNPAEYCTLHCTVRVSLNVYVCGDAERWGVRQNRKRKKKKSIYLFHKRNYVDVGQHWVDWLRDDRGQWCYPLLHHKDHERKHTEKDSIVIR